MNKGVVIFSFDIETRGQSAVRNGLLAVGIVAGTTSGTLLMKKRFHVAPLVNQDYDPVCLEEFWSKHKDVKDELEQNTMSPKQFAQEFRELLNDFEKKQQSLYLLSDNPTFDAGFINYYLDIYGYDSMQIGSDGKTFRVVHDSKSYARGALGSSFDEQRLRNGDVFERLGVPRIGSGGVAHMPDDDAYWIYTDHLVVVMAASAKAAETEKLKKTYTLPKVISEEELEKFASDVWCSASPEYMAKLGSEKK
jgi:hypothetical protein